MIFRWQNALLFKNPGTFSPYFLTESLKTNLFLRKELASIGLLRLDILVVKIVLIM